MRRCGAIAMAAAAALACAGCQQLFTTSLGSVLARAAPTLPATLSAEQATALAAGLRENSDIALATALVDNLSARIAALPSGSPDLPALRAAAASAAIVASGASESIIGTALPALASGVAPTSAEIVALIETMQDNASDSVVVALSYLSDGDAVAAATASGANATDLAVAALVIVSQALKTAHVTVDPTVDTVATRAAIAASAPATAQINVALAIAESAGDLLAAAGDTAGQELLGQLSTIFRAP
jgi:hypothetical protein